MKIHEILRESLKIQKGTHHYVVIIAFLEEFQAGQFPGAELVDDHALRTDVAVDALCIVMQEDQGLGDLLG